MTEELRAGLTASIEPVDQYLRNFQWNKVKYRADKPIAELIDSLQKVGIITLSHGQAISKRFPGNSRN